MYPSKNPHRVVSIIAIVVVAAALLQAPATAEHGAPPDCPELMPISEVQKGMTGIGWTVAEGRHREEFNVEILGILRDAFPGRDLIVVDTSGPLIESNGGIWYGMSGSPVYVNGKLIGAISFGLTWGPSTVGALTPAEEMMRVLQQGSSEGSSSMPTGSDSYERVTIPSQMRARISQATGTSSGSSFSQLKVPVSISGAPSRAMARIERVVEREQLPLVPFTGSAASTSSVSSTTTSVHAADNMVAAFSYGDVTFAGVGTTTFVCEGKAMSFGHPFLWEGDTMLGANAADAITIVRDPFFSYKLANVAEGVGTTDQDRFAGLRTLVGNLPPTIALTSTVTALNNGTTRSGRTDALISEIVPFVEWIHVYGNILFTLDEYTDGNSQLTWKITGTTESGESWELNRSNMYVSDWDIAGQSAEELSGQLYTLHNNDFEEIEFTAVDVSATADDEVRKYKMSNLLVSKDGARYVDVRRLRVRPGKRLYLRAVLTPYDGSANRRVDLTIRVPEDARTDGVVEVGGPSYRDQYICLYRPRRCTDRFGNKIESFADLVAALEGRPTNNELLARLRMGRRLRVKAEDSELLDQVVVGLKRLYLNLPGDCCAGEEKGEAVPLS
jgi:hypothetical protein